MAADANANAIEALLGPVLNSPDVSALVVSAFSAYGRSSGFGTPSLAEIAHMSVETLTGPAPDGVGLRGALAELVRAQARAKALPAALPAAAPAAGPATDPAVQRAFAPVPPRKKKE